MDGSKIIHLAHRCHLGLAAFAAGLMVIVFGFGWTAWAAERTPVDSSTVVFVCEHGAVKSTVAAAYFNRIAQQRGLGYVAVSRGIDLYSEIPATIRSGLASDGLTPNDDIPRDLRADEASQAVKVIAFDHVPDDRNGNAAVTYWTDVPAVTKDYGAGRDAILRHVEEIAAELAAKR